MESFRNFALPAAEQMKMESPSVMFQKIIYDGLVGFYFLREFDVTYDLQNSQMIFLPSKKDSGK